MCQRSKVELFFLPRGCFSHKLALFVCTCVSVCVRVTIRAYQVIIKAYKARVKNIVGNEVLKFTEEGGKKA